jgi:protein O-GlcNAc transferase
VLLRHAAGPGGHLAIYEEIDILLDVFPWGGHATACEALWQGVPVVTLAGNRHASRMVASVLGSMGLSDLVADSAQEYVRVTTALAADAVRRELLRGSLRASMRMSPLCDGQGFTRGLERTYRDLWQCWLQEAPGPQATVVG